MYRLRPAVKYYDWALCDETNLACRFTDCDTSTHVAECWFGSHPSGPTFRMSDNTVLKNCPFLVKIISVGKCLSLQLHPDKSNAQKLHLYNAKLYPDSNAKPEIVVAQTDFEAFCGFLPAEKVVENLSFLEENISIEDLLSLSLEKTREFIGKASACNEKVKALAASFPDDPAALAPLFMYYVHLKPMEALVIPPLVPHCYLSGQGVECMPNSDNVVRAGLTSKMCDIDTFLRLSSEESQTPVILSGTELYSHPCLDFVLRRVSSGSRLSDKGILLVTDGQGKLNEEDTHVGDSWLIEKTCHLYGSVTGFYVSSTHSSSETTPNSS